MKARQFGLNSALCIVLAGNAALTLDEQFRSAKVSEKLSIIRESVSRGEGSNVVGSPIEEAGNCYAGYWRNC